MDSAIDYEHDALTRPRLSGPSSTEDFWMFFSFAMILLVFVLMNYVHYLNSLVVKAPETAPILAASPDSAPEHSATEIHVIVDAHGKTAAYRLGQDIPGPALDRAGLQSALRDRLAGQRGGATKVFVHAPGYVLYQHVFDASYTAWELQEADPDTSLDVHLVFEESP